MTCQCICRLYAMVVGQARRLDSSAVPVATCAGTSKRSASP